MAECSYSFQNSVSFLLLMGLIFQHNEVINCALTERHPGWNSTSTTMTEKASPLAKLKDKRWPNKIVYYYMDDNNMLELSKLVSKAMKHIEKNSCIRFVKKYKEFNYLWIHRDDSSNSGCKTRMGYANGGSQKLELNSSKCSKVGNVLHLLMLSLGFIHEFQRSDRDKYVQINFGNLKRSERGLFKKLSSKTHFNWYTYDYESIMHHGSFEWSKNGQPVVIKKDGGGHIKPIHKKTKLSYNDKSALNFYYECPNARNL